MRISSSLHIAAGFALILVLATVLAVDGKKVEKKEEVKKNDGNTGVQQKPTFFSFIRKLFPNPERTLETLKAVAATAKPKVKSVKTTKSKVEDTKKVKSNVKKEAKQSIPLKKTGKPIQSTKARLSHKIKSKLTTTTTTPKPKKYLVKKAKSPISRRLPTTVAAKNSLKKKTGKYMRDRSDKDAQLNDVPPAAKEMQVLTYDQRRNRLRQELVKETEDNCLAKILCGGGPVQKPKDKNTFVSDSAYLIREFFNIFDFTIDGEKDAVINSQKKTSGSTAAVSNDDKEEESDEEADDEEDEIYRRNPVNESPKMKYTTNKPKRPTPQRQTSQQPDTKGQKTRTSKPMAFMEETSVPKRPKPVSTTTKVTSTKATTTTTIRTTAAPIDDEYTTIMTGGDMIPVLQSNSKLNKVRDRLGEAATLSSNNVLTNTYVSTSISGSATLKPFDLPFEIPIKTAKDDTDDEEDDNPKYTDDEDDGIYHRVTLEELVGDIKLTPADLAMLRRGRSMKIDVNNVTSDRYIQSKLRQLNTVNNEVKKLRIAQKIGRSMREPRQCRQFSQVAQEVLQTCPLTSEVIRFFNANLRNGSSIEVKRQPSRGNSTGGLVILNNDTDGQQQTYLVDNSPAVSSTNYESDLKNPSIPSSFGKDEDQYPVYEKRPNPNPQNANLNMHGHDVTKRKPTETKNSEKTEADSDEEQDDDGDSDEDEEDDDGGEGRKVDEEEEEEAYDDNEDEDEDYDDEDGSDDDSRESDRVKKVHGDHQQIQGSDTNQPNEKVVFRPQQPNRYSPPKPTLPPGIIRVYGVPQPSFDKDFSVLADQLGPRPAVIFGEEDIDRPEYKRRRQLPLDDDESEDNENVAHNSRVPKYPPLESHRVHDGDADDDDDDDDDNVKITKKPYQKPKKKHTSTNSGKPLGGLKGVDGDDDDDDDDDKKVSGKKKNKGHNHSIESVDLNESPFSVTGFYNAANVPQSHPSPHDFFHNQPGTFSPHHGSHHHHQHGPHHHSHPHHNVQHSGYGYRPIVRPIQIIPDVQVPVPFRPTKANMRPGRLYPLYHGKK